MAYQFLLLIFMLNFFASASLLWNYGVVKIKKGYIIDNEDPPRPRLNCVPPYDDSAIVSIDYLLITYHDPN